MAYFGITAKNEEQKESLRALDNHKPITILTGQAGVGKSLLAQAVALEKVVERNEMSKLIYTRLQVDVGADRGFLPGSDKEKLYPYIAPFLDNLDAMTSGDNVKDFLLMSEGSSRQKIFFDSIQSIRGRSLDGFLIVDEAQNLDIHTIAAIATRIKKERTKLVLLGNFSQIDDKKIRTPEQNGFYQLLQGLYKEDSNFKHFDHINLVQTHRHEVVDIIENILRNTDVDERFYELENRGTIVEKNKQYGVIEDEISY